MKSCYFRRITLRKFSQKKKKDWQIIELYEAIEMSFFHGNKFLQAFLPFFNPNPKM